MWQARFVADALGDRGVSTELVPLVAGGDTDMRPIDGTRQVGVFTKRIQQALLDDHADVAVHSLKDLPTEPHPQLVLAAVPARESVHDCLVSPDARELDSLDRGATVGTGSRRRAAQLLQHRSDLDVLPIRGNVQTRLEKLSVGEYDAIVLAEAGLLRLELEAVPRVRLPLDQMLPAPGQGALGIEVRGDDAETESAVRMIDDPAAWAAVTAERTVLAALHGGCLAPIAAHAVVADARLTLAVRVLAADGSRQLSRTDEIGLEERGWQRSAETLGSRIADSLIAEGARELIREVRARS